MNRLTGSVLKVEGNKVVELHTTVALPEVAPAKPEDYHPIFANATIAQQPVIVLGRAKYRGGNMFLRLTLRPEYPSITEEEWRAWRSHMLAARSIASLHINFNDSDGFQVLGHDLSIAEMISVVDYDGQIREFEDQIRIPISAEDYRLRGGT